MDIKLNFSQRASIREAECIGCTKCIQACPFDTILGASKLMHTVMTDACTGCELCIPSCPVDCIEMITEANATLTTELAEHRYHTRQARVQREAHEKTQTPVNLSLTERQDYLKAAIARVKSKKIEDQ